MDILTYALLNKKLQNKADLVDGKIPAEQLPVDNTISSTSENPVQNKVIYSYVQNQATNYAAKNKIHKFLGQNMYSDYANVSVGLAKSYINFQNSTMSSLTQEAFNCLNADDNCIGYMFNIQITNAFDWQPAQDTIGFIAMITSKSIGLDGNYFSLQMNDITKYNTGSGTEANIYKFRLFMPNGSTGAIIIQVEPGYPKKYITNSNGGIYQSSNEVVNGGTIYTYVDSQVPHYVDTSATDLQSYANLLGTYTTDYTSGLGKLFYQSATAMAIFECFITVQITIVDGEPVQTPVIRYIDLTGTIQTVDPTSLDANNKLLYFGYHYN